MAVFTRLWGADAMAEAAERGAKVIFRPYLYSDLKVEGDGECDYVVALEARYEGMCLAEGEHNYRDDSDFFALVWNGSAPEEVQFASTRGPSYENYVTLDATPEVAAAYESWKTARETAARAAATAREAATPRVGKTVRVVAGRKVPRGTVGTVVWYGTSKFGYSRTPTYRVGLKDSTGTVHYTDANNVAVVETVSA